MKKALIVGYTGQDGTYLSELLGKKGYELLGISGKGVFSSVRDEYPFIDITNTSAVREAVKKFQPGEIYYLAAVHQSSSDKVIDDGELFRKSIDINVKSFVNIIDSVSIFSNHSKIFYAASSHIFGDTQQKMQDENSPLNPDCVYGITKTAGLRICRFYREHHGTFASVGVFYNHESPLRESKYVSKKIVETAVAIKLGQKNKLMLGNLDSKIDWGYAPDYVDAAYRILQLNYPDEFIVSSGEQHTIMDFVWSVFASLGLDWEKYVEINPALITKKQKQNLLGNSEKLKKATGWKPTVNFEELIKILVQEELKKHGTK